VGVSFLCRATRQGPIMTVWGQCACGYMDGFGKDKAPTALLSSFLTGRSGSEPKREPPVLECLVVGELFGRFGPADSFATATRRRDERSGAGWPSGGRWAVAVNSESWVFCRPVVSSRRGVGEGVGGGEHRLHRHSIRKWMDGWMGGHARRLEHVLRRRERQRRVCSNNRVC